MKIILTQDVKALGKKGEIVAFYENVIKICDKMQEKIFKELLTTGDFYCIINMK